MKISHIALWVRDLETLKTFYERYFGVQAGVQDVNARKQFQSYFLRFADGAMF